jgi:hypothetical protein
VAIALWIMATAMQKQDDCGHVKHCMVPATYHGGHALEGVVVETVGEAIQGQCRHGQNNARCDCGGHRVRVVVVGAPRAIDGLTQSGKPGTPSSGLTGKTCLLPCASAQATVAAMAANWRDDCDARKKKGQRGVTARVCERREAVCAGAQLGCGEGGWRRAESLG